MNVYLSRLSALLPINIINILIALSFLLVYISAEYKFDQSNIFILKNIFNETGLICLIWSGDSIHNPNKQFQSVNLNSTQQL